MNLDKKMPEMRGVAAEVPSRRRWSAPEVVRLEAGAAEAGTRNVVQDGPLGSYS